MKVHSTRSKTNVVSSLEALNQGLALDGGLFIPVSFPSLDLSSLIQGSYSVILKRVLKIFFEDLGEDRINQAVAQSVGSFTHPDITPLHKEGSLYLLDLFHGPSAAFKDVALQCLPTLIQSPDKIHILTATSGDTGSAALEGFKNKAQFEITVLYPTQGISPIQRKQMTTVQANNVHVYGIQGNFDDAQRVVKSIFQSPLRQQVHLSSANSINLGRLVPQIAYYLDAYRQAIAKGYLSLGDPIVVSIPTGNFGNILAAWYASKLGLPIERFICASNENDVLTEFIQTGRYSLKRPFHITSSPSMDILVSSNLERLLFEIADHDDIQVRTWMNELQTNGFYQLNPRQLSTLQSHFWGVSVTQEEGNKRIKESYKESKIVLDPHTAIASEAAHRYLKDHPNAFVVVAATASPAKFPKTVLKALGEDVPENDFEALNVLHELTQVQVPSFLETLEDKEECHTQVLRIDEVQAQIEKDC